MMRFFVIYACGFTSAVLIYRLGDYSPLVQQAVIAAATTLAAAQLIDPWWPQEKIND